jgi:RHS repeat-associated protein
MKWEHKIGNILGPVRLGRYQYVPTQSNPSAAGRVYFDDVTVTHTPSPIVSSNDYFAFGLQHTTGERAGVYEQRYLYNSKELQDELKIGWLDYEARMYIPEVGRFFTQDRLAEKYLDFSPYQYATNNPVLFIDVNGNSILINYKNDKIIYYNGELTYAGTNKQYQGKVGKNGELKGFVGKTPRALDQIRTGGPVGKRLVDNLQNDSRYVQISQGTANITKG